MYLKTLGATALALLMIATPSHAQRRSKVVGLGLLAAVIATAAATKPRRAEAAPQRRSAYRPTTRRTATATRTRSSGNRTVAYRGNGGGGGGGYTPPPYVYTAPTPSYKVCTQYPNTDPGNGSNSGMVVCN